MAVVIGLFVLTALVAYGISWGVTVGIVWLICHCFALEFDIIITTGIWALVCAVWAIVQSCREER